MCKCYFEYESMNIPDFRWTKTECFPSYGRWTNSYNNAVFEDFAVSPYYPVIPCWINGNNFRFLQPFFDNVVILEIYLILLLFRFFF